MAGNENETHETFTVQEFTLCDSMFIRFWLEVGRTLAIDLRRCETTK